MIKFPKLSFTPRGEYEYVAKDGNRVMLLDDDKGFTHWVCQCRTYEIDRWCRHTRELYSDETCVFDSNSFACVIFVEHPTLIVPTIRTTSPMNGWDSVWVMMGDARKVSDSTFRADTQVEVGMLPHKYTPSMMRSLLLEWLPAIPTLYESDMQCSYRFHNNGDSPLEWRNVLDYEPEYNRTNGEPQYRAPTGAIYGKEQLLKLIYTDSFLMLDTGICLECHDKIATFDQD